MITGGVAFIDTELAGFAIGMWEAGVLIDDGEAQRVPAQVVHEDEDDVWAERRFDGGNCRCAARAPRQCSGERAEYEDKVGWRTHGMRRFN